MKKIIIINGSPRIDGATAKILKQFIDEINKLQKYDVKYYNLIELEMETCLGCCFCYREGRCFIDDETEYLSNEIKEANALIIGSPTYASNVSGVLKTFIDRGHFVIEQLLKDKYAISVITGENYGKNDVKKILNKLLSYSGAKIIGTLAKNITFNDDLLKNSEIINKINRLTTKLDNSLTKQSKNYYQRFKHHFIFMMGIKPFVFKKGTSYQGVIKRWQENGTLKDEK